MSFMCNCGKEFSTTFLIFKANNKHQCFDFTVFKNNKLHTLIEYDGEQHFKPVKFNKQTSEESNVRFNDLQFKDALKDSYCKDNNINLLRIKYTEYNNIENILEDIV
jgi:hypothetical protein